MATVVSSPCLLPKVFDSSTSSATMPLFAPTGLTKACSLPSSLASIRRGSLFTINVFRNALDALVAPRMHRSDAGAAHTIDGSYFAAVWPI